MSMPDRELGLHSLPTSSGSSHGEVFGTDDKFIHYQAQQFQAVPLVGDCDSQLNVRSSTLAAPNFPTSSDHNIPYYQPAMPYDEEVLDLSSGNIEENTATGFFPISSQFDSSQYSSNLAAPQIPSSSQNLMYQQPFLANNLEQSNFVQNLECSNQVYQAQYPDAPNYNIGYNNETHTGLRNFSMQGNAPEVFHDGPQVIPAPSQFHPENYNYTPNPVLDVSNSISSDMISSKQLSQEPMYIAKNNASVSTMQTSCNSYQESFAPQMNMDLSFNLKSSFSSRLPLARHNSLVASASSDGSIYRQMESDMMATRGIPRHKQIFANPSKKSQIEIGNHRSSFLNTFLNQPASSTLVERLQDAEQPLPLEGHHLRSNIQIEFTGENNYRTTTQTFPGGQSESAMQFSPIEPRAVFSKTASPSTHVATNSQSGESCKIIRLGLSAAKLSNDPKASHKHVRLKINITNASIEEINNIPWTDFEIKEGRRIVKMKRRQNMANIYLSFSVVTERYDEANELALECDEADRADGVDVVKVSVLRSSIKQENGREEYFMTSVDFIELIECLVGCRSMDHQERRRERGRIRLNLMKFWLKTPLPSKKSADLGEHDSMVVDLALKIRKYSLNKLPGFNKEVRIMPWAKIVPALTRALEYYYAEVPQSFPDEPSS